MLQAGDVGRPLGARVGVKEISRDVARCREMSRDTRGPIRRGEWMGSRLLGLASDEARMEEAVMGPSEQAGAGTSRNQGPSGRLSSQRLAPYGVNGGRQLQLCLVSDLLSLTSADKARQET